MTICADDMRVQACGCTLLLIPHGIISSPYRLCIGLLHSVSLGGGRHIILGSNTAGCLLKPSPVCVCECVRVLADTITPPFSPLHRTRRGEWEWDGEASSERLPAELEWQSQQWGIYWLMQGECSLWQTRGWWSYSNLQPYSSIKIGALLRYNYSLNTFTWSALRFLVAGPEHDTEYTSPRGGRQGLFGRQASQNIL